MTRCRYRSVIESPRVCRRVDLPISPSTYGHRLACLVDPPKASARHQRYTELRPDIKRVWDANYQVYGVRKAWHQLKREGFEVARCTVEIPHDSGLESAALAFSDPCEARNTPKSSYSEKSVFFYQFFFYLKNGFNSKLFAKQNIRVIPLNNDAVPPR